MSPKFGEFLQINTTDFLNLSSGLLYHLIIIVKKKNLSTYVEASKKNKTKQMKTTNTSMFVVSY